jgi:hypothetical protein
MNQRRLGQIISQQSILSHELLEILGLDEQSVFKDVATKDKL